MIIIMRILKKYNDTDKLQKIDKKIKWLKINYGQGINIYPSINAWK